MKSENSIVLVDGSSYLFRAFHGLPKLTSRAGEPTGAIKGVISMLQKIHKDTQPTHIAVIFDAPGKNFRHKLYPEYKSHRPPIDNDLRVQIKPLLQLIESMGYPLIQISEVEADDVIGTLAKQAVEKNMQVLISTGDKDLAQLINPSVELIDTMRNKVTNNENIGEKFKIGKLRADQVVDFLALVGDSADNIPGIPKVGPKTASKWLDEYDSLENIVINKDKIKGKVGENLRDNLEQLYLSQKLTQIKLDVELPSVVVEELSMNVVNEEVFSGLCQRFDLQALEKTILGENATEPEQKQEIITKYELIKNKAQFLELKSKLSNLEEFYFDIFASSEFYTEAEIVGISFATKIGKSFYLPLSHKDNSEDLTIFELLKDLKELFKSNSKKITYNGKSAIHTLKRYGILVSNLTDDIMLASYVYNSSATNHKLEKIADNYLQFTILSEEEVLGKGAKALAYKDVLADEFYNYACQRIDAIARLEKYLLLRLNSMPGLIDIYNDIEIPLMQTLQEMEEKGILIDSKELNNQSTDITKIVTGLESNIYKIAEAEFNINSPKQLQEILFEKLELPIIKKTPKGQPSTNDAVLQELALEHEIAKYIIENRSLVKLRNTYTDKLPQTVQPSTNRVHTTYQQAVTSTGRLSSTNPNLQNIPIKTKQGRKVRQAFIAPKGFSILASDYSQVELRVMAHISGDELLISSFNENKDIHTKTAAEVFGVAESEVDFEMRRKAKAINFGLIYGMSAFGLSKQIGVSRSEAGQYIETYFEKYNSIKKYMDDITDFANGLGYVETIFGRRIYIPDINSSNAIRRNAAQRLAINAPVQGSAADIIKLAMNIVAKEIKDNSKIKLIMQVHDELVFEVKDDYIEQGTKLINKIMENAVSLKVPLIAESGIGKNWDEAH